MDQNKRATGGLARGMDIIWNKSQKQRGNLIFCRLVFLKNDVRYKIN